MTSAERYQRVALGLCLLGGQAARPRLRDAALPHRPASWSAPSTLPGVDLGHQELPFLAATIRAAGGTTPRFLSETATAMPMMVLAFLGGLVALIVGGELLIRSASRLATDLGVSRLFIGLTVVAFGTSAPEAVVSVVAAIQGSSDLAMGNVVGSSIFNVLFILGLSALITPLAVSAQLVRFDVPVLLGVSVLCLLLGYDGAVGRLDGLVLLALLVAHIVLGYRKGLRAQGTESRADAAGALSAPEGLPRPAAPWKARSLNVLVVVASLLLLVIGSRWLVMSASALARWLGLSELVIGLTVVAAGTSLPEVATSVMAAVRGERDIAVGNVIGSNIFNILGVLGLSAAVAPSGVTVSPALVAFDIPVMVAVAALCLPIFFSGMTVSRWEGGLLLGYFILYTTYVVLRATEHDAASGFVAVVGWVVVPLTLLTLLVVTATSLVQSRRARTSS